MKTVTMSTPLIIDFLEKLEEIAPADIGYSEERQRGIWDSSTGLNQILMSATHVGTTGGDSIGDEAH